MLQIQDAQSNECWTQCLESQSISLQLEEDVSFITLAAWKTWLTKGREFLLLPLNWQGVKNLEIATFTLKNKMILNSLQNWDTNDFPACLMLWMLITAWRTEYYYDIM